MAKLFTLEVELPDDLASSLPEAEVSALAREALIMELLREHRVSQGKAAELLRLTRSDLFPLMTKYQIPVVDLSPDELLDELRLRVPE